MALTRVKLFCLGGPLCGRAVAQKADVQHFWVERRDTSGRTFWSPYRRTLVGLKVYRTDLSGSTIKGVEREEMWVWEQEGVDHVPDDSDAQRGDSGDTG